MIYGRPELSKEMGKKRFLEFYYLETELVEFCKKNKLKTKGDKDELTARIAAFLDGGKTEESRFVLKADKAADTLSSGDLIGVGFVFGKKHVDFFMSVIGSEFVPYEDFLIWLEVNPGKTYGEAAEFWYLMNDDLSAD